ncbi:MAG TPA: Uma2 family endonuclease, partial [Vicinamibacteria bacterium]
WCYASVMASLPDLIPRPFSVADYHRMVDAGILAQDERVELLEGVIVQMSPQRDPHQFAIEFLTHALVHHVGDLFRVRVQLPLLLGDQSQPEPDLAVVPLPGPDRPPGPTRWAALIIEVAEDSLRKDRLTKGRIYSLAGIPEYWIVNVKERVLETYQAADARTGVYSTSLRLAVGETARATAVPGLEIAVKDLFA